MIGSFLLPTPSDCKATLAAAKPPLVAHSEHALSNGSFREACRRPHFPPQCSQPRARSLVRAREACRAFCGWVKGVGKGPAPSAPFIQAKGYDLSTGVARNSRALAPPFPSKESETSDG